MFGFIKYNIYSISYAVITELTVIIITDSDCPLLPLILCIDVGI